MSINYSFGYLHLMKQNRMIDYNKCRSFFTSFQCINVCCRMLVAFLIRQILFFIFYYYFFFCVLLGCDRAVEPHTLSLPRPIPRLSGVGNSATVAVEANNRKREPLAGNNQNAKFRQSLSEKKKNFRVFTKNFSIKQKHLLFIQSHFPPS